MTWVIGASSLFGDGVLLSDIQVSVGNRRFDILQKAYPISKYIAGGFAGSVKIGFMLLQSLSDTLQMPSHSDRLAWDPLKIAPYWSPIAKNIFANESQEEKELGSQFLIVAASPYPIKDTGPQGWSSQVYLIKFSYPDFKPQIMLERVEFCSIGSGANIDKFKRAIQEKKDLGIFDPMLKAEMNPGGWAKALAFSLFRLSDQYPQDGISKNFNIIIVKRGEIKQFHEDYTTYLQDGKIIENKIPKLATNYVELREMLDQHGVNNVNGAIC